MASYNIPILFIIFNRKDTALRSFKAIKAQHPDKLYIASDGYRSEVDGEKELVLATRKAILDQIDWKCEVYTLFQDHNKGCGLGVYSAIDWLLHNEEYGIILEDDCIASPDFFLYVQKCLERYADDSRVGMIAGYNQFKLSAYPYSCLFSRFKSCWGWATWRRAWKNMDINMDWRNNIYSTSIIANSGYHARDKNKWQFELRSIDKNEVSAWDWQWYFSLAAQNQLCIYPSVNLISNIGNDKQATHTSLAHVIRPHGKLSLPITFPPYICPYDPFDKMFYDADHTIRAKLSRVIPKNIKNKIKKMLK